MTSQTTVALTDIHQDLPALKEEERGETLETIAEETPEMIAVEIPWLEARVITSPNGTDPAILATQSVRRQGTRPLITELRSLSAMDVVIAIIPLAC